MHKNNFNPEIYNSYLSHLGQNVLKTMINQWTQDLRNVSQGRIHGSKLQTALSQNPAGNTRVPLTFNNETLIINQHANDTPFNRSTENLFESIIENNAYIESLNNDKVTSNINKTSTNTVLDTCESDKDAAPQINGVTNKYIKSDAAPQINAVTNKYIKSDAAPQINGVTNKYIKSDAAPQINGVTNEYIKSDAAPQINAVTNKYIKSDAAPQINGVTNKYIKSDAAPQINAVTNKYIKSDAAPQINAVTNKYIKSKECSETEEVNWDEMFDIGLFLETNANDSKCTTNGSMSKDDLTYCIPKTKDKKLRVNKCDNNSKKQTNTRNIIEVEKKKPSKITKAVQKITDTSVMKTVNLRKKKYTTAVKHWLENVDNANAVEEQNLEYIDSTKTSTDNIMICENNSKNKKIIQTRLANRDGIMKYAKPKNNTKQDKTGTSSTDSSSKVVKKKARLDIEIKSNILMKDIQHTIVTLSEENYEKHFHNIITNKTVFENAAEVTLLLVYRYLLNQIIVNSTIVCYEGKHILIYLVQQFGLSIDAVKIKVLDVKIGGSLLDPDADIDSFSALQKVLSCVAEHVIVSQCPLQKAAWYSGLLQQCMDTLHARLVNESLWNLFVNIEMRLLPIVAEMERRGVQVDINVLKPMEDMLLNELKAVEQRCYEAAGKKFQINSTVQVRNILYDELKLDSKINITVQETVTKGAKSTSEPMLRSLMATHPLPKLILEYRHLHKAHATYLAGIAQHIRDGVVRPTWVQTAAVTGRIACSNPNLQAIPKAPFVLTLFPDSETARTHARTELKFRSVYVARDGHSFLAADFQHIECRIFAHVANDRALLHMFAQGGDFFKLLASKWLDKSVSAVTAQERDRSKRMVYASLYGAGARKLMDILDMSYDQTLSVLASFNRTFPSLKSFSGVVHARCAATGDWRATTACGRVRRLPDMERGDAAARAHAHRQAFNFIIQGSGADLCKMAMIVTQERLPPATGRLLLQIHDELVWEVADVDLQSAAGLIKDAMENCGRQCGMDIALPVAISHGKNWADMIPI